ncbi:MAG TPA: IclR family transcriptional regulator [Marmoricola sp.]|nr:IclR family transcriptional regulator [Nocardioidaceae bacterium]MCB8993719.1 IclR family transcriptional regulator [Nocardioidaceae bacterium]MCO5324465.1 IclR family transcriptional regulator [Nocardioidaceae bacterium]HRV70121.1 IclR family transcriptional regulator [Marmoricola sp.]
MASKVPAAEHTLRILRYLASRQGPVTAMSVARDLDLPRSTTYHLLTVMKESGFVTHLPEERLYGLGVWAAELSSAFERQVPIARIGRPILESLVDQVGESGHLAVLHGREVFYVVEARARNRTSLVTDVGVRLPAHLTATGRAMLASLSAANVRALYPNRDAFVALDPTGGAWTPARLRGLLQQTRQRGHAVEEGDITPGLSSLALPVFDHLGLPAAALGITFPDQEADAGDRQHIVLALRKATKRLSMRLHAPPQSGIPDATRR